MPTPAQLAQQVEQFDDEQWFDFLDQLDEISRRRRERGQASEGPPGTNQETVAGWLARKHLIADSTIREVWYLPAGAPPDEICFLEVNDRFADAAANAEAIDFGLNIEGSHFRLLVADITSDQLEQIKRDPSRLPSGWSLDGSQVWRRGA